jgi:hypothetical protein
VASIAALRPSLCATTREEIETRRKAFIRKWRLKHRAVADSLEEAGDRLFIFTRLPPSQWRSARTTNAIERLHEEFKRRIKTQTVLPSADTAAMLFWALLASGQTNMRKIDGWQTLATAFRTAPRASVAGKTLPEGVQPGIQPRAVQQQAPAVAPTAIAPPPTAVYRVRLRRTVDLGSREVREETFE